MNELLYQQWLDAKQAEREAVETRRALEDEILQKVGVPDREGTKTTKESGYVVKMTSRYNRKIDADLLQALAIDNGSDHLLGTLFRWKPEIDAKAWAAADESMTKPLLGAITTTPGRPSFTITREDI